ncbi:extracellular solute-binding protein [Salsipaludibacter albus]|uniref:extracellular solute-binding protein n=1 Tax=Salsipaludibacter albus TaxID=2849650 RepID=UPI001EE47FF9|nr:extracellular solute-binding protein [Salsipaludibacter albus]MBY5163434.1 extracellular solute-binding protein [Salsipaludibacter albus]
MPVPARRLLVLLSVLALLASGCSGFGDDQVVRVYSGRHYDLETAFEQFADETGTSVEFLYGSDAELRERIVAEGEDTLADVYMTVDAGNLALAADEGLFQPIESEILDEAVPENLRDPDGLWYGLSLRARTIVYDPADVDPSELSTYDALAEPEWAGRLCLRRSTNVYTQSLVASLIANEGQERALEIVTGWADNARILNNDVAILENIAAGSCDVGITNHYYLARLLEDDPDFPVEVFWANQDTTGVHVNVSGAGVTAEADDPELAQELIEWLATDGQEAFVSGNHEYPVNPDVAPDELIADFGDFTVDPLNAAEFGSLNAEAIQLMAEAGYE